LRIKGLYLDDLRVKVDNINKHYLITSFGSKQRRGNIDGLYCFLYDKIAHKELLNTNITFSDELRGEAKSDGSAKMAFNDERMVVLSLPPKVFILLQEAVLIIVGIILVRHLVVALIIITITIHHHLVITITLGIAAVLTIMW